MRIHKKIHKKIKWKIKKITPIEGWRKQTKPFEKHKLIDEDIKKKFTAIDENSNFYRYELLFKYFLLGFTRYRSPHGERVYYPGAGSYSGRSIDGFEGFSRFIPLVSSWLFCGNSEKISVYGETVNLIDLLYKGIIAGTNPDSNEYWGDMQDCDQRIVEAADIALSLWLSKNSLWSILSSREKRQISNWLLQIKDKDVFSNVGCNWELFPILTVLALKELGISDGQTDQFLEDRFNHYLRNYLGKGWFFDTSEGVDYYNAWAIQYSLFWISQINPNFEYEFIKTCHSEFLSFYQYLFSENAFPIMGRSICYRLAAPAPMVAGAILNPEIMSLGVAFRALDLTWRYFVDNESLRYGSVTQGLCCQNLSILDKYSGPGSCLWSLRSLVVAFYGSRLCNIWNVNQENLPIEIEDFSMVNSVIGWQIEGNKLTQEIKLFLLKNDEDDQLEIIKYGNLNRILEFLFQKPFRPNNSKALYKRPSYSNLKSVIAS